MLYVEAKRTNDKKIMVRGILNKRKTIKVCTKSIHCTKRHHMQLTRCCKSHNNCWKYA